MTSMKNILIARQPIFNRRQVVVGYELLYRNTSGTIEMEKGVDGDQATLQVILNSFAEMGLDEIVGRKKAFINLTTAFLQGKYPMPLPNDRVILEILENVHLDHNMVDSVRNLCKKGFIMALDDVTSIQRIQPLVKFVKIIKVDLPQVNHTHLPTYVETAHQNHIRILAEKVETQEEFHNCHRIGFDYFQGYYFSKPILIKSKKLDSSRLVLLRSLAVLQDPTMEFSTLENMIVQDPALSYKLLRLVNSGYYSMSSGIKSLRQALSILGINQLRGWMSLLLMSSIENKPHELTLTALMRARMAESIARVQGEKPPEEYFLVGLFSILDGMMDTPMPQLLEALPLPDDMKDALLHGKGMKGTILTAIKQYEQGEYDKILDLGITPEKVNKAYLDAVRWSNLLCYNLYNE